MSNLTRGIPPHGGVLVNRELSGRELDEAIRRSAQLKQVELTPTASSDLELIANGGFSPLIGFMNQDDYEGVVEDSRLANGTVWSLPITLDVNSDEAAKISLGQEIALVEGDVVLAVMEVADKFGYDKAKEANQVYRTVDKAHPGVERLYGQGDVLLGGPVSMIAHPRSTTAFTDYQYTPAQTRAAFEKREWRRIVAFQTRNPIHRAHEYITKCALELVDGLLVHPLVGETKGDDISAEVRMKSYVELLSRYYPADRTMLSVFPAAMRYAGPREAIFHAIVRKNYGCTHLIVGRDHAGVGAYYGTYDAQRIFDDFGPDELGITPLFFEHSFYCEQCGMGTTKTCPCDPSSRISLSGTQVREMLTSGALPPPQFTRPEVAQLLAKEMHVTK